MIILELFERLKFWRHSDRLGPDIPGTHWRLHFKSTMRKLCIEKFSEFGEGAEFRPGAYAVFCSRICIGKRVVLRPGTMLFADGRSDEASIIIEDDAMLGSGVHIYVHNHEFSSTSKPIIDQGFMKSRPVTICRGAWIGAGVIILPGVIVGTNAVVGAGSVLTKSVPPFSVVAGNPARILRNLNES